MDRGNSILSGVLGEGRLDSAVAAALPELSRARVRSLIDEKSLMVDGVAATDASTRKLAGKVFELLVPAPRPDHAVAQDISLDIVFEDQHLLVVDKPAGLVVHPSVGHHDGTLVNALLHHCRGKLSGIGGVERPGIVHRIDRETSGLLVVAKSDMAHEGLSRLFATHDIERRYLAIVSGIPAPPAGTVRTQISRSTTNRKKMAVLPDDKGKHAVTHYRLIEPLNRAALVECMLETGRTHQVRVHMAHIGHALIGDPVYSNRQNAYIIGPNQSKFERQALHAKILGFIHPITGETLRFESRLPEDMQLLLSALRI